MLLFLHRVSSFHATIVLEIVNGEVIICSTKTASSKRTANQALAYLDSNKDVRQNQKRCLFNYE
jgi:hypothetical protein